MTRRYVITGSVQGVGFRYFVLRRATGLGLTGWVRNLPDGRVEVAARGSAAELEELETALKAGPRLARVASVDKFEISDEIAGISSFEIR